MAERVDAWARRAGAVLAAVVALGGLPGCEDPVRVETPDVPDTLPSFLLIVVDTLRADRVRFAGYSAGRSPSFDALRDESIWFENAYATSSWTLPSTASLFTSRLVSGHHVSNWGARLGPEQETLVDALGRAGYRTGMWTANLMVAGRRGFAQRFEHSELIQHPDFKGDPPLTEVAFGAGTSINDSALQWLQAEGIAEPAAPFFAYLHFMEPHAPYLCAEDAPPGCLERAYALNSKLSKFDWALDSQERELLDELYDAEVSRMDAALRALLDGMEGAGLLRNTWVLLVSDHGEMLGESGMYGHGRTLYEAMIHVPLLVRKPSGEPGRVETPVSLIDVAPTILDLAGLPIPDVFRGRSLRPALDGGTLKEQVIISELLQVGALPDPRQKHFVTVIDGEDKYVMGADGRLERFDLSVDPSETRVLSADRERFDQLLNSAGVDFDHRGYSSPEFTEPTPKMLQNLKELGYIR